MKLIIAGSRGIKMWTLTLDKQIKKFKIKNITEIVSGGARGMDHSGEIWAKLNNIPIKRFLPNWDKYQLAAGPIRNKEMAEYADALLIVWDGESKGSANMIKTMKSLKKPVYEIIW